MIIADEKENMLFGISSIGKTSVWESLAKNLAYPFYVLDTEIHKKLKVTQDQFVEIMY
ncbi:hypothetical protein [Longibaculum muris]|uniref:hypothetical protein n=1 Tax=Longibaculum muris TaxID=1796628 RepID=UPI0018A10286|nr:hypothetical protein [Longibaculum muris]